MCAAPALSPEYLSPAIHQGSDDDNDEGRSVADLSVAARDELYGNLTGFCAISAMTPTCSGKMRSMRRAWLDSEAW